MIFDIIMIWYVERQKVVADCLNIGFRFDYNDMIQ